MREQEKGRVIECERELESDGARGRETESVRETERV